MATSELQLSFCRSSFSVCLGVCALQRRKPTAGCLPVHCWQICRVLSSRDQGEEEEKEEDYWMWLSSELCGQTVTTVSVSQERGWSVVPLY